MKLRIDPAYLAGLIHPGRRPDVEHCAGQIRTEEGFRSCGKPTRHGKFFCIDHIMSMPYAKMIHDQVDDRSGERSFEDVA